MTTASAACVDHRLLEYGSDEEFVAGVAPFVLEGLRVGESALLVASPVLALAVGLSLFAMGDAAVFYKIGLANERGGTCAVAGAYYRRYLNEAHPDEAHGRATTAPTEPIPRRSDHDDQASRTFTATAVLDPQDTL